MNTRPENRLTCLSDRLRNSNLYHVSFWKRSELADAVEVLVDLVNPKIRVVGRYNKMLRTPLDNTWQYLDTIVEHIPGGLTVSRQAFAIDPRVRVLFEDANAMNDIFSTSPVISKYLAANTGVENLYVMLCMEKQERAFLGTQLEGDMIKREVMQTAVTFSSHQLLSPAENEALAKEGIKCCAFEGLLKKVQEEIMYSHFEIKKLEERKHDLMRELRARKTELGSAAVDNTVTTPSMEKIKQELTTTENNLINAKTQSESPQQHLQYIVETLNEPELYLSVKPMSITVNNLGIKVTGQDKTQGHVIDVAELNIDESFKRTAMVVNYQKTAD